MAKSIRSKIKKKHRAEFRRTIGTEAHNKAMDQVQSKLKEIVKKGSMKSFDRIADMLDTDGEPMVDSTGGDVDNNNAEKIQNPVEIVVASGENKAPSKGAFKKTVKRKHKMRGNGTKEVASTKVTKEKPKPRFFCEF